jgi:monoamine oxidase
MTKTWDAVVVGGGFAGLAAARELAHTGADVLLLEGRDRLGGRTWTGSFAGHPVELGGAYVHWHQPHVWSDILRYGLTVLPTVGAERAFWISEGRLHEGAADDLNDVLMEGVEWFCRDAEEAVPFPFDPEPTELARALDALSVQDRLDEIDDPLIRDLQDSMWTSLGSAPAAEIGLVPTALSTYALASFTPDLIWETSGAYTIVGGTGALVSAMREDLRGAEVQEGSTVRGVARDDGVVRVCTDGGVEHVATTCILALPVNVLRSLSFTPDLDPGRRRVVDEGILGRGVKLWARLRGEVPHFYALAPGGHAISLLESESYVDGDTVVSGFGPSARDLDIHDRASMQRAVAELVPEAEVLECGGHDWRHDPFSGTTWGSFKPGQWSRSLKDLQRPEGRTFFAGGDIANGWAGYIDGAIESGIAAGRGAMALLAKDA